jgi:prepilin-type N-terminal cleavage/methylation domain-containing protein
VERQLRGSSFNSNEGFTLLELIICVAIVGVLTSVAGPALSRSRDRARSAEAKVLLSNLYIAEKTFFLSYSTYTTRLDVIGFSSSGSMSYEYGFSADFSIYPPSTPLGNSRCYRICGTGCPNRPTCKVSATYNLDNVVDQTLTADRFTAGAHAHWSTVVGGPKDTWTINEKKILAQHPGDGG